MSSAADEIQKLFALMGAGALSREEFDTAKAAVLRRAMDGPAPSAPAAPAPPAPSLPSSAAAASPFSVPGPSAAFARSGEPPFRPNCDGFSIGGPALTTALGHLRSIVANIAAAPGNDRLRRLREGHPRLAAEVFCEPGAAPFLASLGFRRIDTDDAAAFAQASVAVGGPPAAAALRPGEGFVHVLPASAVPPPSALAAAIAALDDVAAADAAQRNDGRHAAAMRRRIAFDLRREAWQKAQRAGELSAFVKSQLARAPLAEQRSALALLRTVVANALAHPGDAALRTLRGTKPAVRDVLLAAPGALELLAGVAGFALVEDAGSGATAATAVGVGGGSDVDASGGNPYAAALAGRGGSSGVWSLVLPVGSGSDSNLQEALALVSEMDASVAAAERADREAAHGAAVAAVLAERAEAKREAAREAARAGRGPAPQAPPPAVPGSGKRVPIAVALRMLLRGNSAEDDEGDRIRGGGGDEADNDRVGAMCGEETD